LLVCTTARSSLGSLAARCRPWFCHSDITAWASAGYCLDVDAGHRVRLLVVACAEGHRSVTEAWVLSGILAGIDRPGPRPLPECQPGHRDRRARLRPRGVQPPVAELAQSLNRES
jgi:hypothetical protein